MTSPVSLKILAGPVSAFISQDLKFWRNHAYTRKN